MIETTVLVDNNQVIVLGGLIDDDIEETISSVPLLGKIPLLGRLFRSSSNSVVRRNLTVFLRPKILADSQSINQVSLEKYNFIKAEGLLNEDREKIIDLTPQNQE
jgi:general secretion pathway protein D